MEVTMATTGDSIDFEAIKQAQQKIWSAGDFAMVATTIVIVSEELCEAVDVLPGEHVLDVACGSGNTTLAAARRAWGNTVGLDYVPELLERGRARAEAERLEIEWVEGDAEQLPFPDGSFDVALSTFGAMFAPNQERAAGELLRVCRSGGRIGMANWTPDGSVGHLFKTVASHVPPPPGVTPPVLWGTEAHVRELFGDGISSLEARKREVMFRFFSAEQYLEFFRTYFGPIKTALERLDEDGQKAFAADVKDELERFNVRGERALVFPGEYLEVVATRA
jgi:ubiquinone/menaquinone biosynthesis C-methylase UbiE